MTLINFRPTALVFGLVALSAFSGLAAPNEAVDNAVPPAIKALLPAPQKVAGASVEMIDAGYEPDSIKITGAAYDAPLFFCRLRATPGAQLRFLGFWAPDTQWAQSVGWPQTNADGSPALIWHSHDIDPRWPYARSQFEVTAPDAPATARGEFSQQFPFELPLPFLGKTLPLGKKFVTAHGSRIEIVRVATAAPAGNGNGDSLEHKDGTLVVEIRWQPPADAPRARLDFTLSFVTDDNTDPTYGGISGDFVARTWTGKFMRPPHNISVAQATLQVEEAATQWRDPQYFGIASFDLPVAQLANARTLKAPIPPIPLVSAQDERATAQLSQPVAPAGLWSALLWTNLKEQGDNPGDNTDANIVTRLVATEATLTGPDGQTRSQIFSGSSGNHFFDPTNQILGADKAAQKLSMEFPQGGYNAPLSLTVKAQEKQLYSSMHQFRALPIPLRGQILELGAKWSDDSARVARIQRHESGSLTVVCENGSLWDGKFSFNCPDAVDNTNFVMPRDWFRAGDGTRPNEAAPAGTMSFDLEPPAEDAQTFDFAYGATEAKLGASHTFQFDNLKLKP